MKTARTHTLSVYLTAAGTIEGAGISPTPAFEDPTARRQIYSQRGTVSPRPHCSPAVVRGGEGRAAAGTHPPAAPDPMLIACAEPYAIKVESAVRNALPAGNPSGSGCGTG